MKASGFTSAILAAALMLAPLLPRAAAATATNQHSHPLAAVGAGQIECIALFTRAAGKSLDEYRQYDRSGPSELATFAAACTQNKQAHWSPSSAVAPLLLAQRDVRELLCCWLI